MKNNYSMFGGKSFFSADVGSEPWTGESSDRLAGFRGYTSASQGAFAAGTDHQKAVDSSLLIRSRLAFVPCLVASLTAAAMIQFHASNIMIAVVAILFVAAVSIWLCTFLFRSLRAAHREAPKPLVDDDRYSTSGKLVAAIHRIETGTREAIDKALDRTSTSDPDDTRVGRAKDNQGTDRQVDDLSSEISADDRASPEGSQYDEPRLLSDVDCVHNEQKGVAEASIQAAGLLTTEVTDDAGTADDLEPNPHAISQMMRSLQDDAKQADLLASSVVIEAMRLGNRDDVVAKAAEEVRRLASVSRETTTKMQVLMNRLQEASAVITDAAMPAPSAIESTSIEAELAVEALCSVKQTVCSIKKVSERIERAVCQQRRMAAELQGLLQQRTAASAVGRDRTHSAGSVRATPRDFSLPDEMLDQPWKTS